MTKRQAEFGPFDPEEAEALLRRLLLWCETPALTVELNIPEVCEVVLPLLIERRLSGSPREEKA